jgi:hypothetical protein
MAQYQAWVEYKRIPKGSTSSYNMKDLVYIGMKNVQLVKGKIKAKYPNDKIMFVNITWK